ncbi:hypothetical protein QR680_000382 [Steinernema hermaphroditum]|uniref:Uncharacterized protein n=1 Tax=Steinernema hermaphroditum TaxID=289476 RepID=A0AA39GWE0_9BILA|nr:hypothetical protein QR680_000382 [Steinernema hermaphroditum]
MPVTTRAKRRFEEAFGDVPGDFANLTNNIIWDLIKQEKPEDDRKETFHLAELMKLHGPWKETLNAYSESHKYRTVNLPTDSNVTNRRRKKPDDRFISKAKIWLPTPIYRGQPRSLEEMRRLQVHEERLVPLAPKMFGSISFQAYENKLPKAFMDKLGNRFDYVAWEDETQMPMEERDFFKRQLRSKYLRGFLVEKLGPTDDFLEPLKEFVRMPHFERLDFIITSLPLEVFDAAYDHWKTKTFFEVSQQRIASYCDYPSEHILDRFFPGHDVDMPALRAKARYFVPSFIGSHTMRETCKPIAVIKQAKHPLVPEWVMVLRLDEFFLGHSRSTDRFVASERAVMMSMTFRHEQPEWL